MDRLQLSRGKAWWVAGLSCLLPGLGHIILKQYFKGAALIISFLYHILLGIHLIQQVQLQVPLTVALIIIAIPIYYFYALYDALQIYYLNRKITAHRRVLFVIVTLFSTGVILLLLGFSLINEWVSSLLVYYPLCFVAVCVLYLLTHLRSRQYGSMYVGRLSAVIGYILLGVLFFIQIKQLQEMNWIPWFLTIILLLVIECILYFIWAKSNISRTGLRIDVVGVISVLMILMGSYFVLLYSDYPTKILKSFHGTIPTYVQFDLEKGQKLQLEPLHITIPEYVESIHISHLNGFVKLISHEEESISIQPVLYDQGNEQEVDTILDNSNVQVKITEHIHISTNIAQYGDNRLARMNLLIYIPSNLQVNKLQIDVDHGAININGITGISQLDIATNTADVNVYHSSGNLNIDAKRANIFTLNHEHNIDAKTNKGNITIYHPLHRVSAKTLTGNIYVKGNAMMEDWHLHSSVGSVSVNLPKHAELRCQQELVLDTLLLTR